MPYSYPFHKATSLLLLLSGQCLMNPLNTAELLMQPDSLMTRLTGFHSSDCTMKNNACYQGITVEHTQASVANVWHP